MPLRISLAKQVLERKILLDLMIQKYKSYNTWLSRLYNLSSISTATIATVAESIGSFESAPILIVVTAIISFTTVKIRDVFNVETIINRCKEQLVKYETLYQKILVATTEFQIDSIKETLQSLGDFDVEIDHEILIEFDKQCKKHGIRTVSNDVDKLKTLNDVETDLNNSERTSKISDVSIEEIMNGSKNNSELKLSLQVEPVEKPETKKELQNRLEKMNIDKDLKESMERFSNISSISLERLEKIKK